MHSITNQTKFLLNYLRYYKNIRIFTTYNSIGMFLHSIDYIVPSDIEL